MHLLSPPKVPRGKGRTTVIKERLIMKIHHHSLRIHKSLQTSGTQILTPRVSTICLQTLLHRRKILYQVFFFSQKLKVLHPPGTVTASSGQVL